MSASQEQSERNNARLVIIDPVQAFLGADVDMNRANEVRPIFRSLGDIAQATGCAIVLIGHLNKAAGTQSTYRGQACDRERRHSMGLLSPRLTTGTRQAWQRRQGFYRYLNVAALLCSLIPTPPDDEQSPGIFHLQEDFE